MDNITIGLWVTGGMLVLVVFLGMRVAFAAALAGLRRVDLDLLGQIRTTPWMRFSIWNERREMGRCAGQIHCDCRAGAAFQGLKSQALSLIPTFILIGYLAYYAKLTTAALFDAAKKLDRLGAGRPWRSRPCLPRPVLPPSLALRSPRRRSLPALPSRRC